MHSTPSCCCYIVGTNLTGRQGQVDRAVATVRLSPKKNKVYCDKWVHEGICAFTQQGCRYKHEMPYDKATQRSLGLFHGLPAWWRKLQADQQRQGRVSTADEEPQDKAVAVPGGPNRALAGSVPDTPALQQDWRKGESAAASARRPGLDEND